ncbi:MAG: leucine-rich repeat domain-containing protein [Firmicutes bacterium]|nr:leucine-rich repeat domain-containing protein [Bacillota bacterium]
MKNHFLENKPQRADAPTNFFDDSPKAQQIKVAEKKLRIANEAHKAKEALPRIIVSLLLIFSLFVSVTGIALGSVAVSGMGELEYRRNGNGYEVVGIRFNDSRDVVIPATHRGKPVVAIADRAFLSYNEITSMTIPKSVTSIGGFLFFNYGYHLTSVIFEEGSKLTSIGYGAFYGCTSLTSITIPNSVTSIGLFAFANCTSLISITIPNSVTTIGSSAFNGCTSLTSITIPFSVTSIGESAFSNGRLTTIRVRGYSSAPSGWHSDWNSTQLEGYRNTYHPVIWNYYGV